MSLKVASEYRKDGCDQAVFARIAESTSFLFTSSDCSLSDEAISALVDALQSPHCRLTDFSFHGELDLV